MNIFSTEYSLGGETSYIGGGSIDLDPDLSPSYALDFGFGFFHTIIPIASIAVMISALFLVPYFILKRKKIPSRPYMALILSGILLHYGITGLIALVPILSLVLFQISKEDNLYLVDHVLLQLWIDIVVIIIAGILLYRSSVIRKLLKK